MHNCIGIKVLHVDRRAHDRPRHLLRSAPPDEGSNAFRSRAGCPSFRGFRATGACPPAVHIVPCCVWSVPRFNVEVEDQRFTRMSRMPFGERSSRWCDVRILPRSAAPFDGWATVVLGASAPNGWVDQRVTKTGVLGSARVSHPWSAERRSD